MKYLLISILFLFNDEIMSLIALSLMMVFFFADILKERLS